MEIACKTRIRSCAPASPRGNSPMLDPRCMIHFERPTMEGFFNHSLPSSYVPSRPWHDTYLKLGTWARVRSSSSRDKSNAKYWIGFLRSSKACKSRQTLRRFLWKCQMYSFMSLFVESYSPTTELNNHGVCGNSLGDLS